MNNINSTEYGATFHPHPYTVILKSDLELSDVAREAIQESVKACLGDHVRCMILPPYLTIAHIIGPDGTLTLGTDLSQVDDRQESNFRPWSYFYSPAERG